MSMSCLAIEHEKTRQSLKDAFEDLFVKYGREFDDGDEIDIMNLRIVKKGGFLANSAVINFGNRYKKSREHQHHQNHHNQSDDELTEPSDFHTEDDFDSNDEIDEQVFEQVCTRIKKSQAISRLQSSNEPAYDFTVHFVPNSILCESIKTEFRGQHHFDSLLFVLIKEEIREDDESRNSLVNQDKRLCHCNQCFNCLLLQLMIN